MLELTPRSALTDSTAFEQFTWDWTVKTRARISKILDTQFNLTWPLSWFCILSWHPPSWCEKAKLIKHTLSFFYCFSSSSTQPSLESPFQHWPLHSYVLLLQEFHILVGLLLHHHLLRVAVAHQEVPLVPVLVHKPLVQWRPQYLPLLSMWRSWETASNHPPDWCLSWRRRWSIVGFLDNSS